MVQRRQRNGQRRRIHKRTVRGLYALRHYAFRRRLLNKAEENEGTRVILVNEAYTSKTCTHCGWIHAKLGGNKVFHCEQCHHKTPRDVAGARNILLRFATKLESCVSLLA